jgi:hypothetical protein
MLDPSCTSAAYKHPLHMAAGDSATAPVQVSFTEAPDFDFDITMGTAGAKLLDALPMVKVGHTLQRGTSLIGDLTLPVGADVAEATTEMLQCIWHVSYAHVVLQT